MLTFKGLKKQLLLMPVADLSKQRKPWNPVRAPFKMLANGMLPREVKLLMALAFKVFKKMREN